MDGKQLTLGRGYLICKSQETQSKEEFLQAKDSIFVHTITGTAANVHDSEWISELICPDDEVVYGDSGYLGAAEQEAICSNEDFSKLSFV